MNSTNQIQDNQTTKTESGARRSLRDIPGTGMSRSKLPNPKDSREWWTRLPSGEKAVVRAVFRLLGIAKRNQSREIAQAAVKWERSLGCFIKVRLMAQWRRAEPDKQPLMNAGALNAEESRAARLACPLLCAGAEPGKKGRWPYVGHSAGRE